MNKMLKKLSCGFNMKAIFLPFIIIIREGLRKAQYQNVTAMTSVFSETFIIEKTVDFGCV